MRFVGIRWDLKIIWDLFFLPMMRLVTRMRLLKVGFEILLFSLHRMRCVGIRWDLKLYFFLTYDEIRNTDASAKGGF